MGKKKWLTKAEIKRILKDYSVRPDEFEPVKKLENYYKSKYAKGYIIVIKPEEIHGRDIVEQTGRILVQHCKSNGNVTYTDIWERTKESKVQFFCRQQEAELPDSVAYVQDLREEIERLQKENKNLQQQLLNANKNKENEIDTVELKELLNIAIKERNEYRQLYQDLKSEMNIKRNAGRKKRGESDASKEMLKAVQSILNNEPENKEPWLTLGISRAGFFRYKKLLRETK